MRINLRKKKNLINIKISFIEEISDKPTHVQEMAVRKGRPRIIDCRIKE